MAVIPVVHQPPVPWSTGLCDCFDDPTNCCLTFCCPCITFGQMAEILDKGSQKCGLSGTLYALIAYMTGCTFCYSCGYRSKLRAQYNLEENPCSDCCVHFWCESCALCQEYRELKNRGFDMSKGWDGNMKGSQVELHGAAPPVVPPVVQKPMMHR